jgi:hypothetical protein
MIRTAVGALVGTLAGLAVAALILRTAWSFLAWRTAPRLFEVEHGVIYLALVLGAGFGALCGALAGLAGAVLRAWRERPPSP